jgi:hypothetical protein
METKNYHDTKRKRILRAIFTITFCGMRYLFEDVRVGMFLSYIWWYVFHRKHEDSLRVWVVVGLSVFWEGEISFQNTKTFDFPFP